MFLWYNDLAMIIKFSDIIKITLAPFLIYVLDDFLYFVWTDFSFAHHLDIHLHFVGGMAIAGSIITVLSLARRYGVLKINNDFVHFAIVTALVVSSAVMWEFYEFSHDIVYGTHYQPSNFDTMKDLFLGTIGGMLWWCFHRIFQSLFGVSKAKIQLR